MGAPQQAMRQAPSETVVRGASVRGVPTRSMRGMARKREGGQFEDTVADAEGVPVEDAV